MAGSRSNANLDDGWLSALAEPAVDWATGYHSDGKHSHQAQGSKRTGGKRRARTKSKQSNSSPSNKQTEVTWKCNECDHVNPEQHAICNGCNARNPEAPSGSSKWKCAKCGFVNFANRKVCKQCSLVRPPPVTPPSDPSTLGSESTSDAIDNPEDLESVPISMQQEPPGELPPQDLGPWDDPGNFVWKQRPQPTLMFPVPDGNPAASYSGLSEQRALTGLPRPVWSYSDHGSTAPPTFGVQMPFAVSKSIPEKDILAKEYAPSPDWPSPAEGNTGRASKSMTSPLDLNELREALPTTPSRSTRTRSISRERQLPSQMVTSWRRSEPRPVTPNRPPPEPTSLTAQVGYQRQRTSPASRSARPAERRPLPDRPQTSTFVAKRLIGQALGIRIATAEDRRVHNEKLHAARQQQRGVNANVEADGPSASTSTVDQSYCPGARPRSAEH